MSRFISKEDRYFIAQVKAKIEELGINVTNFCKTVGVCRSSVSNWKAGKFRPNPRHIKRIIEIYPDITYDWSTVPPKKTNEKIRKAILKKEAPKNPLKEKRRIPQYRKKKEDINTTREAAISIKDKINTSQRMYLVTPLDGSKPFTTNKPEKYPSQFYKVSK